MINATDYTDPNIQLIRSLVEAKSDAYPFLLLPVKIETRFMRVDRQAEENDYYAEALIGLFELKECMSFIPAKLPVHEVIGKVRKLGVQTKDLQEICDKIKPIPARERSQLQVLMKEVSQTHLLFSKKLSELKWRDFTRLRELRKYKNTLAANLLDLTESLAQIELLNKAKFGNDHLFLNNFGQLNTAIQQLGAKKLDTKDRRKKRVAFSFVEGKFNEVEHQIKLIRQGLNSYMQLSGDQLDELDAMNQTLSLACESAEKNLKKVRSRYKKTEYLERIRVVADKIQAFSREIEMRIKPKMQMKDALRTIDAKEVIWQINAIRYQLKEQNRKRFRSYGEIKSARTKLYKKLHGLRQDVHKIVEGTNREQTLIFLAWDDTDLELEKFTQRVRSFKARGTEKAGKTRTITHINEEYRKDLAGLKSSSKSYFRQLNNIALEKSASCYMGTLELFRSLNQELRQLLSKLSVRKINPLLQQLIDAEKLINKYSKDIVILPQEAYNELSELADQLVEQTEQLIERKRESSIRAQKNMLNQQASAAVVRIRSIIKAQHSDSIQRKDRFYDEERNPFVFAGKTQARDELWVRIFPDDIAIHTHEEALTLEEVEAGKAYWLEIWMANDDYEAKLAAWRAISTAYGSQRAAWIVKNMEPLPETTEEVVNNLAAFSRTSREVNNKLSKVIQTLSSKIKQSDRFSAYAAAYPILLQVEQSLRDIEKEHINILGKTQRLLVKLQSIITQSIRKTKQERLSTLTSGITNHLETFNQFVYTFNRVVKHYSNIQKTNSREILLNLSNDPVFPSPDLKDSNWSTIPHSKVMPDRFVVLTMRDDQFIHIQSGNPLPDGPLPKDKLAVGLDPDSFSEETFHYDTDGNLIVDEKIRWLTDYDEAERLGMAISITLDEQDLENGFDKVFVLGIKDTTPQAGKKLLEQLLDNHHYIPEGASFLPIGTPTNNSEAGASAYRTFENDAALSFAIERNKEEPVSGTPDPDFPTDAEHLSNILGIDIAVLNTLDYSSRFEISEALTMNKALFHATIGNYMEEGLDQLFTLDNINHAKAFFCNYITARGFLPALRIGTQPYGILPTTAFSQFHATNNDNFIPQLHKEDFDKLSLIQEELQTRFDIRLKQLLDKLDELWTNIRTTKVLHAGNTNPANPQAHFMEMLGLQATSEEYHYRYGLNIASRIEVDEAANFVISFDSSDLWGPANVDQIFKPFVSTGYFYASDYFTDEQLSTTGSKDDRITKQFYQARVFSTRHLKAQAQILGHLIDNRELATEIISPSNPTLGSAEEQLKAQAELQNYIDWLVDQNPWKVLAKNKYSRLSESNTLIPGLPSKSLLFILLRHSLLSAHADAILKILEHEELTDQRTRKKMGQPKHYYNRFGGSFSYVTKWTYLFSKIERLNGVLDFEMDESNSFFNYMRGFHLNRYVSPEHQFVFNNYPLSGEHQAIMEELDETRECIRKLKGIPTARLKQLLTEHIDLCTYRLDAWKLGQVNKRITQQRESAPTGIYLGAYGWVEDLRKGGERALANNLPAGLWKNGDGPVYTDADNLGFIHTPSLNHAITAAMLRAGFHANAETAEANNQMAVNLSSMRVRMALNLLNGIRNGQEAAAMLGYQFERGLHERYLHVPLELDQYIYDFRDEFPLAIPVDEVVDLGETKLTNVVNGLELLEFAQDFIDSKGGPPNNGDNLFQSLKTFESEWWSHVGNANLSSASEEKRDAMLKEIDRLADAFDALGDLCISESIYQVVRGNHIRSSAIMDKLAKGDVPRDIEILDTPRTGTVVTHKVGIFFEMIRDIDHVLTSSGPFSQPKSGADLEIAVQNANAAPAGWDSPFTERALADPTLNKWIGQMIGNPATIKCRVHYKVGEVEAMTTLSLADLQLQALDILHLFGTGPLDGGAELKNRIAYHIKNSISIPVDSEETADDTIIKIHFTQRDASWAEEDCSFYEKAAYIQNLRAFLTSSAVLAADALHIPGDEELESAQIKNQDLDEYLVRMTNLKARLDLLAENWESFFSNEISIDEIKDRTFTTPQIDQLRALLIQSSRFGIPGTIPENLFGYENEVGKLLMASADGAYKAISNRLKQADKQMTTALDSSFSHNVRVNAVNEASRHLLGRAFVMIPHFILRNAVAIDQQLSMDRDSGLLRATPMHVMETWLQGLSRVRERVGRLDTLQMWAENFGHTFPDIDPIQFPFEIDEDGIATDPWLGVEFPVGYQPEDDKLSIVLLNSDQITTSPHTPKAALLIDEWVEIIPSLSETTGIAFQYDQPDAKPPNNLLLAVTPKETGNWTWDNIVFTLADTLKLAKNRAVEPEHLEDTVFGQILPGILTEIVPPQLLPEGGGDSGDAQDNPLGLQVVTDFGIVNDTFISDSE